jgi:hypothetical protein
MRSRVVIRSGLPSIGVISTQEMDPGVLFRHASSDCSIDARSSIYSCVTAHPSFP